MASVHRARCSPPLPSGHGCPNEEWASGGCTRSVAARILGPAHRLPSAPVDEVKQSQGGVPVQHARPTVAHHGADLLPHVRLVAVDRALGTSGLALLKGAPVQTGEGVVEKLSAVGAEFGCTLMLIAAVQPDHGLDGSLLLTDPVPC